MSNFFMMDFSPHIHLLNYNHIKFELCVKEANFLQVLFNLIVKFQLRNLVK